MHRIKNNKDGFLFNLALVSGYINAYLTMTDLLFSFLYFSMFSGVESPVKHNEFNSVKFNFIYLTKIIYMKKLLDSYWLRTVPFFLNTVQKRGN